MPSIKIPKYKVVNRITRKGYPTSARFYHEAHSEALNAEKSLLKKEGKSQKDYKALKKMDTSKKFPKNALLATHTRGGKITIARKAGPYKNNPKYFNEEAVHEVVEDKAEKRLEKEHKARKKAKK